MNPNNSLADNHTERCSIPCVILSEGGPVGGEASTLQIAGPFSARGFIDRAISLSQQLRAFLDFSIEGVALQVCWTSDVDVMFSLYERQREYRQLAELQPNPLDVLAKLVKWAEHMGGWEAPVWQEAARLVEHHHPVGTVESPEHQDAAGKLSNEQVTALRNLDAALGAATDVGLLDVLLDGCQSPDSINDVCDAVQEEVDRMSGKLPQTMSVTHDVASKKPFEVPAINNQKLALMRYLKLDGEDDADYEKVKELGSVKSDSNAASATYAEAVFEYNNERYHVAHATAELEADVLQEFNSNFWRIRKVEGAESVNQPQSGQSPGL